VSGTSFATITHKRCKKLYLINGYFQHWEAIKGYYNKLIESKQMRYLDKVYGPMFKTDKLYEELHSPALQEVLQW
jgi:hypothetical protein